LPSNTPNRPFLKLTVPWHDGNPFAKRGLRNENNMGATLTTYDKAMLLQDFYGLLTANGHKLID